MHSERSHPSGRSLSLTSSKEKEKTPFFRNDYAFVYNDTAPTIGPRSRLVFPSVESKRWKRKIVRRTGENYIVEFIQSTGFLALEDPSACAA